MRNFQESDEIDDDDLAAAAEYLDKLLKKNHKKPKRTPRMRKHTSSQKKYKN